MADIHDRGRATAIRMLAPRSKGGKGLELTLVQRTQGAYDPITGGSSVTEQRYVGSALRDHFSMDDVDGTFIRVGDVRLLLSPVQINGQDMPEPATQDRIEFDGDVYTALNVKPWNYAGVTCGFEVQARR